MYEMVLDVKPPDAITVTTVFGDASVIRRRRPSAMNKYVPVGSKVTPCG